MYHQSCCPPVTLLARSGHQQGFAFLRDARRQGWMQRGNRGASWTFQPSCFISGTELGCLLLSSKSSRDFNASYGIIAITDRVGDRLTSMLQQKDKSRPGEFGT